MIALAEFAQGIIQAQPGSRDIRGMNQFAGWCGGGRGMRSVLMSLDTFPMPPQAASLIAAPARGYLRRRGVASLLLEDVNAR